MDANRPRAQHADAVSLVPVSVPPEADTAAQRLRSALAAAGFDVDRDFEYCRADVTTSGLGNVTLGRLSLSTATRLCEALEAFAAGHSAHEGDRVDHGLAGQQRPGADRYPDRDEDEC